MPSYLDAVEFAKNPEPRCACVLLLDTSESMSGGPITALNQGLRTFQSSLKANTLASQRIEVAIVTFNSQVEVVQDFVTIDHFHSPELSASGLTFMGGGILTALDLLQKRKTSYKSNGISYYRPWLFLITDGEPQGEPEEVVAQASLRLQQEQDAKKVEVFGIGIENADMSRLRQIIPAKRPPLKLHGLDFQSLFLWLSASMQSVSQSQIGDQLALPPPGWGTVSV